MPRRPSPPQSSSMALPDTFSPLNSAIRRVLSRCQLWLRRAPTCRLASRELHWRLQIKYLALTSRPADRRMLASAHDTPDCRVRRAESVGEGHAGARRRASKSRGLSRHARTASRDENWPVRCFTKKLHGHGGQKLRQHKRSSRKDASNGANRTGWRAQGVVFQKI